MTRGKFLEEINTAREQMWSSKTTPKMRGEMIKRLGRLVTHPELEKRWREVAWGQLQECMRRKTWIETRNNS